MSSSEATEKDLAAILDEQADDEYSFQPYFLE